MYLASTTYLPPALPTIVILEWPEHLLHCQVAQSPNGSELDVSVAEAVGVCENGNSALCPPLVRRLILLLAACSELSLWQIVCVELCCDVLAVMSWQRGLGGGELATWSWPSDYRGR